MRRFHEYYEINQTPSDLLVARIDRTVSAELPGDAKRQTASAELQVEPILQTLSKLIPEDAVAANVDFKFAMAQAVKVA